MYILDQLHGTEKIITWNALGSSALKESLY